MWNFASVGCVTQLRTGVMFTGSPRQMLNAVFCTREPLLARACGVGFWRSFALARVSASTGFVPYARNGMTLVVLWGGR